MSKFYVHYIVADGAFAFFSFHPNTCLMLNVIWKRVKNRLMQLSGVKWESKNRPSVMIFFATCVSAYPWWLVIIALSWPWTITRPILIFFIFSFCIFFLSFFFSLYVIFLHDGYRCITTTFFHHASYFRIIKFNEILFISAPTAVVFFKYTDQSIDSHEIWRDIVLS